MILNKNEFTSSIDKINPTEDQKFKMLNKITCDRQERKITMNFIFKTAVPAVLSLGLVWGGTLAIPHVMNTNSKPQIQIQVPAADTPMGMRKMMNYNGHRYVFLENGATFNLDKINLTEELGILEYNIAADPKNNSTKDFAASFAVGGTVYKIPLYAAEFRIAVKQDGNYYIGENVDTLDGTNVNAAEYLAKAKLSEIADALKIYDHFGRNELATIERKQTKQIVGSLEKCTIANLTNNDYETIARAQNEGKSFLLSFALKDGTRFKMYVIPSLKIAMIGDNKYKLSDDFTSDYIKIFDGLNQKPLPAH
jgi:hypothetical protein